jgi:hypothetical protein
MKRKTYFIKYILSAIIIFFLLIASVRADECTTAVISAKATVDGRPLLWKNRDTDEQNNKLVFLSEGPFLAVGLANVGISTSIWMGCNEKGFAMENSDSEDLEGSSGTENGQFLRYALLHCASVADFEALLLETNSSGRKTQANYGVIDATGAAAIFETGNHTFRKYDANDPSDAPYGFIVRTNFAFTGDGSGTGYVRYDRAVALLTAPAIFKTLTHEFLLHTVARDLNNGVIDPYPLPYEGSQDGLPVGYIRTNNSINRFKTRSCVVFHGILPGENPLLTTMWVILGEPVCSIAVPVWVLAGSVPAELGGPVTALMDDTAIIKRAACYSLLTSPEYINTYKLDDGLGGGIFSFTLPTEDWTFKQAREALSNWRVSFPAPETTARVQNEIARQAYWCLLSNSAANEELSAPRNLICWTFEPKELLFRKSAARQYLHLLRWRPPEQREAAGYRIYDVSSGERILLAEIPADNFSFFRRVADPARKYIYAVLAIDSSGKEGSPACADSRQAGSLDNYMVDRIPQRSLKLSVSGQKNWFKKPGLENIDNPNY